MTLDDRRFMALEEGPVTLRLERLTPAHWWSTESAQRLVGKECPQEFEGFHVGMPGAIVLEAWVAEGWLWAKLGAPE